MFSAEVNMSLVVYFIGNSAACCTSEEVNQNGKLLQSLCIISCKTWSQMLHCKRRQDQTFFFNELCMFLEGFLVTGCFAVFVPQVPSSQPSRCCVELAVSWSQSEVFVVCSGSTWQRPSSRYWQLLSWLDGSWASSGEWTWSSWQVSTCPAASYVPVWQPSLLFSSTLLFKFFFSVFLSHTWHAEGGWIWSPLKNIWKIYGTKIRWKNLCKSSASSFPESVITSCYQFVLFYTFKSNKVYFSSHL